MEKAKPSRHAEMTKALKSRQQQMNSLPVFYRLAKHFKWLFSKEMVAQFILVSLLTTVVVLLAVPSPTNYQAGEVAKFTVRADHAFRLPDPITTEKEQRKAALSVPVALVLDDQANLMREKETKWVFQQGRDLLARQAAGLTPGEAQNWQLNFRELQKIFTQILNLAPDSPLWAELVQLKFSPQVEAIAFELSHEALRQGILDSSSPFRDQSNTSKVATVRLASSGQEYVIPQATHLFDPKAAARFLAMRVFSIAPRLTPLESNAILTLAQSLTRPNLSLSAAEMEKRITAAQEAVGISYFDVRAGEVIVREGSIITPEAAAKIQAMRGPVAGFDWFLQVLGFFVGLFVFFNASLVLAYLGFKNRSEPISISEQAFLTVLLMLVAILAYSSQVLGASLTWDFDFVSSLTIFYAVPIPMATMLVAIFFGVRKASFMALFGAVVATMVSPSEMRFSTFFYCYNGAIAAAWCLRHMNERSHLINAFFWVMIVNMLTLLGLTLFTEAPWGQETLYNFLAAGLCAFLSAIMASGLIALVEVAFGFNTDFKLLELSNLDRPMLRDLMLQAPGTYHHSVIVGTMVEAAAEAIGANPHLAKVGAYYHDIGKMKKPLYFVENQKGENRHDTLAPSMSALILIGHVREGAELARANGLPARVVDIVEQHHGTSLMSFFYHKAKEQRQEGQPEVNESDYRYPGPKPKSKEAGIVMLGDICEAATRSLSSPTPTKINNMVRQLVNQIFSDGQLDDCALRTSEISEIINTFTNILVGIYHQRVAYPTAEKETNEPPKSIMLDNKGEALREIYGHLPIESAKGTTH